MSSCLIVNGSGPVAVALTRELCQSGYHVYLSVLQCELSTLHELEMTNPELVDAYETISHVAPDTLVDSIANRLSKAVDCVVFLNKSTRDGGVVLQDLDLLKHLGESQIMDSRTDVLVGLQSDRRIPDDMVFALEDRVIELAPLLPCHSITTDFNDLFRSEEEIVRTSVVPSLRRSTLRVKSLQSWNDFVRLVLFYLLPDFLLALCV